MYISTHTVAHHLRQAFRKLSIASRVELTRIVIEQATGGAGHSVPGLTREEHYLPEPPCFSRLPALPSPAAGEQDRVPPGQYVAQGFPVLSAGPTPHTPLPDDVLDPASRRDAQVLDVGRVPGAARPGRHRRHPLRDALDQAGHHGAACR